MTTYIKFGTGTASCFGVEMTGFYFYCPEFSKHIPRLGDMCKAVPGQVFVPSSNNLGAAKDFAETQWGVTIKQQDGQCVVCELNHAERSQT